MQHSPFETCLSIVDYSCWVHLGCTEQERAVPQEVRFSLDLYVPQDSVAEKTDSLDDALCYADVCASIKEYTSKKSFNLVESLAKQILEHVKDEFSLKKLKLVAHKVNPPVADLGGGVKYACSSWS